MTEEEADRHLELWRSRLIKRSNALPSTSMSKPAASGSGIHSATSSDVHLSAGGSRIQAVRNKRSINNVANSSRGHSAADNAPKATKNRRIIDHAAHNSIGNSDVHSAALLSATSSRNKRSIDKTTSSSDISSDVRSLAQSSTGKSTQAPENRRVIDQTTADTAPRRDSDAPAHRRIRVEEDYDNYAPEGSPHAQQPPEIGTQPSVPPAADDRFLPSTIAVCEFRRMLKPLPDEQQQDAYKQLFNSFKQHEQQTFMKTLAYQDKEQHCVHPAFVNAIASSFRQEMDKYRTCSPGSYPEF